MTVPFLRSASKRSVSAIVFIVSAHRLCLNPTKIYRKHCPMSLGDRVSHVGLAAQISVIRYFPNDAADFWNSYSL